MWDYADGGGGPCGGGRRGGQINIGSNLKDTRRSRQACSQNLDKCISTGPLGGERASSQALDRWPDWRVSTLGAVGRSDDRRCFVLPKPQGEDNPNNQSTKDPTSGVARCLEPVRPMNHLSTLSPTSRRPVASASASCTFPFHPLTGRPSQERSRGLFLPVTTDQSQACQTCSADAGAGHFCRAGRRSFPGSSSGEHLGTR